MIATAIRSILVVALAVGMAPGCDRAPVRPRMRADTGAAQAAAETTTAVVAVRAERSPAPPVPWTTAMQEVADGANRFAIALHRARAGDAGDRFCSPFSLHAALAMTKAGARGATEDELRAALHLPAADGLAAAGDLARFYGARSGAYQLAVASALWGQADIAWNPAFVTLLDERFGAGFRPADFAADPYGQRSRINAAVAADTGGRIAQLVPDGAVTALTRLCLTNAITFKGSWATTFDAAATSPQPFHRADGSSVPLPLMHRDGRESHFQGDGFQVLALPYEGDDIEMVVLLPATADGLAALEAELDADRLARWRAEAESVEVSIRLPRFRLRDRLSAERVLRGLGVGKLFEFGTADLTGMTPTERLAVGAVLHEAFVEVDEEGTVAAAATVVITNAPGPPPPRRVEFRADRPFVFLIRDVHHGTILFLGRYTGQG
ncbi:MAG: serpin family protein [Planctomycetaceae bacterium]